MSAFTFTDLVDLKTHYSACLGASATAKFTNEDVGKPVKMGSLQNYVLCAEGDEIEGIVSSINAATYNDGFSFGGYFTEGRAIVKAAAGITFAAPWVVAGVNTLNESVNNMGKVKAGTTTRFHWRMIRNITHPGATTVDGDIILIEFAC